MKNNNPDIILIDKGNGSVMLIPRDNVAEVFIELGDDETGMRIRVNLRNMADKNYISSHVLVEAVAEEFIRDYYGEL